MVGRQHYSLQPRGEAQTVHTVTAGHLASEAAVVSVNQLRRNRDNNGVQAEQDSRRLWKRACASSYLANSTETSTMCADELPVFPVVPFLSTDTWKTLLHTLQSRLFSLVILKPLIKLVTQNPKPKADVSWQSARTLAGSRRGRTAAAADHAFSFLQPS